MKRSVHDLSLPGFQIGSHIGDWNLDSPKLYPIYKVSKSCFLSQLVSKSLTFRDIFKYNTTLHLHQLLSTCLKTAEDLGTALFVHPWDMQMGGRHSKYWLPWLVGKFEHARLTISE